MFISLEDETGVSNAIVDPDLFERFRLVITEEAFLLIEGQVQNSDGVVLIKARDIKPLVHERLVGSESHELSRSGQPWHRVERLEHIVGWFDKWLMGATKPEYDVAQEVTVKPKGDAETKRP